MNPTALKVSNSYKYFGGDTKPKVLILFCGGTLIMKENEDGSLVVMEKDDAISMLLSMEPKLQSVAQMDVHYVDNIDSSNMTPSLWDTIGGVIHEKYNDYDGFVVTHGTDTMAYTSSALSFVLGDLGKPVVLTGAQIPGQRIETDARRNFINAIRVATCDRAGVMLVFDGDIILGARAHKMSESKLDAFGPINWGLMGEIRIDIRFHNDDAKARHDRPLQFQPGFDENVCMYTLFPGFPITDIQKTIDRGENKGIILNAYGSGNISYKYLEVIQKARAKGIAVVVTTQCLEGATLMHLYDVGRQALENGAIQAYDMSNECITTKLMWVLHRAKSLDEVEELMHRNYTGEINSAGHLYGAKT